MAFDSPTVDGLYQKVAGGVWYVRRAIPAALRPYFEGRVAFKASTKTREYARALHIRNDLWCRWSDELNYAEGLGGGRPLEIAEVEAAIDLWRRARCAAAAGADTEARYGGSAASWPITSGAKGWVDWFFGATYEYAPAFAVWRQPRERGSALPHSTGLLLGRLQRAARDADAWAEVDGLDDTLDAVVAFAADEGDPRVMPRAVRLAVRQTFARAALEVVQHEEAERRRADAILAALETVATVPSALRAAPPPVGYEPREGDKTVQEVLDAFKAYQANPVLWQKQYGHIARALGEIMGLDKPIRALTRLDAREVRRFLETLPTNVTKLNIFKDKSLVYAAERAAVEGLSTLAPNTVRSYMVAFKGICDFACDPVRGWLDENPVEKEVPPKKAMRRRHGREAPPEPSRDLVHLLDQIPLPSPAHGDFTFGSFDGQPWVFEACGDTGAARRLYTPWGVQSGAVYRDRDNRRGLRLTLLSCGSRLVEIDAPAALIADAKAFRAEMLARGVAFTPDGGERAASLVAQFQPSKPVSVFDRPGWREPGVFLTPWGEVIAADDAEPAALSRAGMPRGDAKAGTLEGWTEAVSAAFGLGLVQMQLGVIAGLTSPVLDLCGYESRSLFFGGAAGRGKSTSHELQCSAWGDPAIKMGLFGTFAVSANAPELMLQQGAGAGIAADEVKHLRSSLQQFFFMVWSGTGKSRMDYRAFGLKEAARWSCLFVTSYEDSLAAKIRADGETLLPGLGARVLEIAADAKELTPEAVAPVLAVHDHYGHGGPAFIRAMFDQGYADDPDTLRKEVEAKADTLMKVRRSDQRRAAITAALMWQAGEIGTEAGLIPEEFPLTPPEAARKGERESVSDDGEGREPDHGEAMPPASDLERLMYAAWINAAGAESAATDVMSKAVDTLIRNLVTGLGVMVADGADGMTRGPRLAFQMPIQPVAGGGYRDVYVIPVPGVAALAEAPVDPGKIAKALDARGALLRYERAPGQDGRNRATERTWPHVPGLGKVRALIVPVSAVT